MLVIHLAFECAPIFKTGGLGDVVGSLPIAQKLLGIEPMIALPKYSFIRRPTKLPGTQIPVLYIADDLFDRTNVNKSHRLEAPAYAAFAIELFKHLKKLNLKPDILHCHDWHTGLIPFLLKKQKDPYFAKTRTVLTIHNIGYQGRFPRSFLNYQEGKEVLKFIPEHVRKVSYLKEGILASDFVTTVSPHHAVEIRRGEVGRNLKSAIRAKGKNFVGILNGIDYKIWTPRYDSLIHKRYTRKSLSQKIKNKLWLQKKLGLTQDASLPLFGFVGRLAKQKGLDLLVPILDHFETLGVQLALLGTGERKFEEALAKWHHKESKSISVDFEFSEARAHEIYTGADFLLIPSHYEPCGLTQMIAMSYGTVPVAASVGGLKDSIKDNYTGILFKELNTAALKKAIERSILLYKDVERYNKMTRRLMLQDFSWVKSAKEYAEIYNKLI